MYKDSEMLPPRSHKMFRYLKAWLLFKLGLCWSSLEAKNHKSTSAELRMVLGRRKALQLTTSINTNSNTNKKTTAVTHIHKPSSTKTQHSLTLNMSLKWNVSQVSKSHDFQHFLFEEEMVMMLMKRDVGPVHYIKAACRGRWWWASHRTADEEEEEEQKEAEEDVWGVMTPQPGEKASSQKPPVFLPERQKTSYSGDRVTEQPAPRVEQNICGVFNVSPNVFYRLF